MDITTTVIIMGIAAAFVFGLSKTGFPGISILGIVIIAVAFPDQAKQVPGIVLPMLLVGDLLAVAYYQKHTDWPTLLRLFPSVAVGMLLGIWLMDVVDGNQFKKILGGVILALIVLDMARKWWGWNQVPHARWFGIMMGVLAGFTTYIGNAAGPVMAIYLLAIGMSKERFIGCSAWFFFIVNMTKVPFYTWQGTITAETLHYDLYIVPGMVLGAIAGRYLLQKTPQKVFEPLILFLAALGALHMVGALSL